MSDDAARDLRSYGRKRGRKPSARQERLLNDVLPLFKFDPANFESTPPSWGRQGGGDSQLSPLKILPPPLTPPHKGEGDASPPFGRLPAGESHGANEPLPAPCGRLPAGESHGANKNPSHGANETWLEIGFGGGEHLIWQATHNPEATIIGCEPFQDGVIKVLAAIEDHKLSNIRIHTGDARPLLRALPAASIAKAFVLFPDPWPKKKHVKRRLVSAPTLSLLARAMKPGAELRIATDIGGYVRSLLLEVRREGSFEWTANSPQDWRQPWPEWPGTRYEAKALREGRKCHYFTFHNRPSI